MTVQVVPAILCGGAGSRLWPVSRALHPKPFLEMADGQSLLQKAFLRGVGLRHVAGVLTVTNQELLFKTQEAYAALSRDELPLAYILEPFGRNTAPAIAMACLYVRAVYGAQAVLLVLPADHLVTDTTAFSLAVDRAVELAAEGKIVTFGVKPDRPETGFGYIEAQGERVARFIEKPPLSAALAYVDAGNFFWNSGMFCFSAATMLEEMTRLCPDVLETAQQAFARAERSGENQTSVLALTAESFAAMRDVSIDYAVMEKSDRMAVVPCDIGWSDIGSWAALGECMQADAQGNRVKGPVCLHDVQGSTIRSDHRMVGAVGVRNLIVVDTPDALLVADRDHAQDVKHVYASLKATGHDTHKLHRTVARPWGSYTVIEEGPGYKIKRIEVKPGARLSLQSHRHRNEHWVVVSGQATVINGQKESRLQANESTYISAGTRHRLSNATDESLILIEVQTGSYLGEDDIVRYDDVYGRARDVAQEALAKPSASSKTSQTQAKTQVQAQAQTQSRTKSQIQRKRS